MAERKPLVVGLTGQTGAGNTTVSDAFSMLGYAVINADLVARENPDVVKKLAGLFGMEILSDNGTLNRKALGNRVFSDPEELKKLDALLYPIITERIRQKIDRLAAEGRRYILLDAPTLFESGAAKLCQKTIAVLAEEKLRKERIMQRDGLTESEAAARISAQNPDVFYRRQCDFILRNNGSLEQLSAQGEQLVRRMEKRDSQWQSILLAGGGFLLFMMVIWGGYQLAVRFQYPIKYEESVTRYAEAYAADPALVYAVIRCESSFRPDAVSSAGAIGLMQITEETFDWAKNGMGAEAANDTYHDLFDPDTAIRYGTYLLSRFLTEFGSEENALAAYHAGWGQVKTWLSDETLTDDGKNLHTIPGEATDAYVKRVVHQRDL